MLNRKDGIFKKVAISIDFNVGSSSLPVKTKASFKEIEPVMKKTVKTEKSEEPKVTKPKKATKTIYHEKMNPIRSSNLKRALLTAASPSFLGSSALGLNKIRDEKKKLSTRNRESIIGRISSKLQEREVERRGSLALAGTIKTKIVLTEGDVNNSKGFRSTTKKFSSKV